MSRIVARGSLRVDARRAVEKLREHLLVDLHQYAIEIVRAAVAFGAKNIDVRYGADEIGFAFDGAVPPPEVLPRLLDHILEDAGESRPARLLALGVNAALGLDPASVDLVSGGARVRWTPASLASDERPEPVPVPQDEAAPPGTMRVCVRRRLGWDLLRSAVSGDVPREVDLLAEASHHARAPLTLGGRPFPLAPRPAALVRVPFSVTGARSAFVEIVQPSQAPPSIELLELGMALLRTPLVFGGEDRDLAGLPVRAVVDADALPTNASRSALREDAAIGRLAGPLAYRAFIDGLAALGAVTCGRGEVPEGALVLPAAASAREDALAAVAIAAASAVAAGGRITDELRAVLDLPLLSDAHGRPLALSAIQRDHAGAVHVWKGDEPLPEELAPWTGHVVWLRGKAVERALAVFEVVDAAALVQHARAGAERKRKLLSRAPSGPSLPASLGVAAPAIRAPFEVREGDLAGLSGEVAVLPGAMGARKIHVFIEGRPFQTAPIDEALLPLPIEAAIAWDGRITPRFSYDEIEPDESFRRAVHYASVVAAFAVDREIERLVSAKDEAGISAIRDLARAAVAGAVVTAERLGLPGSPGIAPPLSTFRRLYGTAIWPTTDPEAPWESAQRFATAALRTRSIAAARPGTTGRAPDGRPVLAAPVRERAWLAKALRDLPVVPYDGVLLGPGEQRAFEERRDQGLGAALGPATESRGPVMRFERPGRRGLIAASAEARATHCHQGRVLEQVALPSRFGPIAVVVDDDGFVPTPGWDALRAPTTSPLGEIERAYCERLLAALEGDAAALTELGMHADDAIAEDARLYLLDRVHRYRRWGAATTALAGRIERLPLVTMLDAQGSPARVSLAAVAEAHPKGIPVLAAAPGFETLDWRPLIVPTPAELASIQAWAGGDRAAMADGEIVARRRGAEEERDRRAFLSGMVHDPRDLGDLADAGATSTFVESPDRITVAIALPRAGTQIEHAWVDVLFAGRGLCRRALPLEVPAVARVGLVDEGHVSDWRDLSDAGLALVTERVRDAAAALAIELVQRAFGPGRSGALFGDLRALRLVLAVLKTGTPASVADGGAPVGHPVAFPSPASGTRPNLSPPQTPPIAALHATLGSDALAWPTVQGDACALHASQRVAGERYTGSVRHVPWRRPEGPATDLDAPVLCFPATPEGEAALAILWALGERTRDVSPAIAALQERRASAAPDEIPRLEGAPAHPALRIEIGPATVGEIEIVQGPGSEIHLIDLAGTTREVPSTLPFPVRAVVRVNTLDASPDADRVHVRRIARAAGRHLVELVPRLDELPELVRQHLRAVVCDAVDHHRKIAARVREARIFQDTGGAWHSLAELCSDGPKQRGCTQDPPPYPRRSQPEAVLRLTAKEMRALAHELKLVNLTSSLRRELEGERRAAGPQVARAAIEPDLRAKCVHVVAVDAEGLTGEVGLLAPEHAALRGVALFATRRLLCHIGDGEGWPVAAAINDDDAPVNRGFDGLRSLGATAKIQRVVRAAASRALRAMITPPRDAIGVRWVEDRLAADLVVAGALWMPRDRSGPHLRQTPPVVRTRAPDVPLSPRSLVLVDPPRGILGAVPIAGQLLVSGSGWWPLVATFALRVAAEAVKELPEGEIAAAEWELRLLGREEIAPGAAPTGDGGSVDAAAVLAELAARGRLWITDRQGDVDGAFPDGAPGFVLLDGSPLVEALRRCAAPGVLATVGATPAEPAPEPEPVAIDPDPEAESSWLSDLWGALRSWLGSEEPGVESALTQALQAALDGLSLTGRPVLAVAESRYGRPLRYDPAARRLLVNVRHRALGWVRPSSADDERDLALLTAAAVSEINARLEEVTDEEERRALGSLLARLSRAD